MERGGWGERGVRANHAQGVGAPSPNSVDDGKPPMARGSPYLAHLWGRLRAEVEGAVLRVIATAALLVSLALPAVAQDRSADFASALHLRPDQQAADRGYMAATRPDQAIQARRQTEAAGIPQMTTSRRIEWSRAQLQADLASLDRQGAAVKRFHAQLTPEQRRTFDELSAPPSRLHEPGHRPGRGVADDGCRGSGCCLPPPSRPTRSWAHFRR